jgi:hypothetical protein
MLESEYIDVESQRRRICPVGSSIDFDVDARDGELFAVVAIPYSGDEVNVGALGGTGIVSSTFNLTFADLIEFAGPAACTLNIALAITGRATQNCLVEKTLTLDFDGTNWVATSVAGGTTDSGDVEAGLWRSTLTVNSVTANGTGLVVNCTISSTAQPAVLTGYSLRVPMPEEYETGPFDITAGVVNNISQTSDLKFYNIGGTQIGSTVSISNGHVDDVLEALIEAQLGEAVTVTFTDGSAGAAYIDILFATNTAVTHRAALDGSTPEYPVVAEYFSAVSRVATTTATLATAGYSYTARVEFFIRPFDDTAGFILDSTEASSDLFTITPSNITLSIPADAVSDALVGEEEDEELTLLELQSGLLYYRLSIYDESDTTVVRQLQGDIFYPRTEGYV